MPGIVLRDRRAHAFDYRLASVNERVARSHSNVFPISAITQICWARGKMEMIARARVYIYIYKGTAKQRVAANNFHNARNGFERDSRS